MIKLFADTANTDEIDYCFSRGVNDGITTNPKIMETTGDLSRGFERACRMILERYPKSPVSLETDLRGVDVKHLEEYPIKARDVLLEQAYTLASWGENVVIKIPVCGGGLLAAEVLSRTGIKTNVTACMTQYQALAAAKVGAAYVSLFANRMLDSHLLELAGFSTREIGRNPRWPAIIKDSAVSNLENAWEIVLNDIAYVAKALENSSTSLIIGSIRTPKDIYRIARASPQIITIPTGIVKGLENIPQIKISEREIIPFSRSPLSHPMTQHTLEEFEKAADIYRKK